MILIFKESMVVLEITFDEGLLQNMWELTLKLYDYVNLKKDAKVHQRKQ